MNLDQVPDFRFVEPEVLAMHYGPASKARMAALKAKLIAALEEKPPKKEAKPAQ